MNDEQIRSRVLELFLAQRVEPTEAFDPKHFLDFLLPNPTGRKHLTANSFAGLRRRNRFFQHVEQEFALCFGTKDFERLLSLERFVARIRQLQDTPQTSRDALAARRQGGSRWRAVVLVDVALVSLAVATHAWPWLSLLFVVASLAFTGWAVQVLTQARRHDRALAERLGVT